MQVTISKKSLWEAIREKLEMPKLGLLPVDNWDNIYCCRLDKDWLTGIFREKFFRDLGPERPLVLVSQTGIGKTTLIFKMMLPEALRTNQKILYLSNRISLTNHVAKRAIKDEINGNLCCDFGKVKELDLVFKTDMLRRYHNFGTVDIYTYQEFVNCMDSIDFSKYEFVVLDEAHYFVSDATFNPLTEETLEKIIENAKCCKRVYLTATPDEVIGTIYQKEIINKVSCGGDDSSSLQVYVVDEDYSYMNLSFFNDKKWIENKIRESKVNDYWLIFIRDKKTGEKLVESLKGIEGDVDMMTRDTKRDLESYQKLIGKGEMPCRVLIATKFLDVGVDINTRNLRIVIFEDNIVEVKQMIGRKRIKDQETIEVYFYAPPYNELKKRQGMVRENILRQKEAINTIETCGSNLYYLEPPFPFYVNTREGLKYNSLSLLKLEQDIENYQKLIVELENCSDEECFLKYEKLFLANFPGINIVLKPSQELDNKMKKDIEQFAEKWIGRTISKDELNFFSADLTDIVGDKRKDIRVDRGSMGVAKMKEALKPYGYTIESNNKDSATTYRLGSIIEGGN